MNIFNLFRSETVAPITIPTYSTIQPDPTNLQIKAYQYIFRRLQISTLSLFEHNFPLEMTKLDNLYNLAAFIRLLTNDEYRILIEFTKNKFRACCILNESTAEALHEDDGVRGFRFDWLATDVDDDHYVEVLSRSDIYLEFPNIDLVQRRHYVRKILANHTRPFDYSARNAIIRDYLCMVAFNVQLDRLYRTSLKQQSTGNILQNSVSSNLSPSPRKLASKKSFANLSASSSPTKLSSKKSMINLIPDSSSPRLKTKASIRDFRDLENGRESRNSETSFTTELSLSPPKVSASPPKSPRMKDSNIHESSPRIRLGSPPKFDLSKETDIDDNLKIYQNCEKSIKIRLIREKSLLGR